MVEEPAAGSKITVIKISSSMKAWCGNVDPVGCVMVFVGGGDAIKPAVMNSRCIKGCDVIPSGKGYLAVHFWYLKKLLERRGYELGTRTERQGDINDDKFCVLRGCIGDREHLSRWDNRGLQLQQVVKQKWRIWSSTLQHRPPPPVVRAAVYGILIDI